MVFGSFIHSSEPNDMDVAVFQESDESYLPLALKYRRMTRSIAESIPIDIVPLRMYGESQFLFEIEKGKVLFER
ncbi:MAG: nucleotidyltransferase domain-containing protein [Fibrobacterota bacterium]